MAAAIATAPDRPVEDEDNPPTRPEDWDNAIVSHSYEEHRQPFLRRATGKAGRAPPCARGAESADQGAGGDPLFAGGAGLFPGDRQGLAHPDGRGAEGVDRGAPALIGFGVPLPQCACRASSIGYLAS